MGPASWMWMRIWMVWIFQLGCVTAGILCVLLCFIQRHLPADYTIDIGFIGSNPQFQFQIRIPILSFTFDNTKNYCLARDLFDLILEYSLYTKHLRPQKLAVFYK